MSGHTRPGSCRKSRPVEVLLLPRRHVLDGTGASCAASPIPSLGLDECEVRRYPGWYRHITLATLAHAVLSALTAQAGEAAKGTAETDQHSSRSPWRRSGGSWTLSCPTHEPTATPSPTHWSGRLGEGTARPSPAGAITENTAQDTSRRWSTGPNPSVQVRAADGFWAFSSGADAAQVGRPQPLQTLHPHGAERGPRRRQEMRKKIPPSIM